MALIRLTTSWRAESTSALESAAGCAWSSPAAGCGVDGGGGLDCVERFDAVGGGGGGGVGSWSEIFGVAAEIAAGLDGGGGVLAAGERSVVDSAN